MPLTIKSFLSSTVTVCRDNRLVVDVKAPDSGARGTVFCLAPGEKLSRLVLSRVAFLITLFATPF